jgi:asparagine synthase (glutamine-hydrolysing)
MIALFIDWTGRKIEQSLAQRVASSLAVGRSAGGQFVIEQNVMFAAVSSSRVWRPARTANDELVIFSGAIDNKDTIPSDAARYSSDNAALYAAAYMQWGESVDTKLVGKYSAIIFSRKGNFVKAVRSPILAPPLHFFRDGESLVISSTPRAIFATDKIQPEVDEQKIADSLLLNYNEGRRSWYRGISRVETGTALRVTPDQHIVDKYYNLDDIAPVRFKKDSDYVEAANELFQEGVKASLAGFKKPAILLSGGYDSQGVAAHALTLNPGLQLTGLTSVPEPGWDGRIAKFNFGDESAHVAALGQMYPSLDLVQCDARGLYLDEDKQKSMFLLSNVAPRNAENLHWIFECYRIAKERGCDILLNGMMGNTSFSFTGDGAIPSWFTSLQWRRLWTELEATKGKTSRARNFLSRVIRPLIPTEVWHKIQRVRGGDVMDPFGGWSPLSAEWAEEMNVVERAKELDFDIHYRNQPRSTREWRSSMVYGVGNEGGDLDLTFETLSGLRKSDPTAYRPLVEFCLSIPDDQYLRNGQYRWLAKRMLRGLVPDMVLDERRMGRQGADWHLRMGRRRDSLKRELEALEADPAMARRFDLPNLKAALNNWPAETPLQANIEERALAQRLELAVARAVTTARFIQYVEGKNR